MHAAIRDACIDVANDVCERVRPAFLVTARQVRVPPRVRAEERRILGQEFIRAVAAPDPQLVLLFLPPPQRRVGRIQFDPEVVLVTGAHLANRRAAARAVLEPDEDRCEILALHAERLTTFGARRKRLRARGRLRLRRASSEATGIVIDR